MLKALNNQRVQSNFGNAGAVENLFKMAMAKAAIRATDSNTMELHLSDIEGVEDDCGDEDALEVLSHLYK